MRTLVMGDVHGAHKALQQCLERSNFNKKEDILSIMDLATHEYWQSDNIN